MKTLGYLVRVPSGVPLFFQHNPKKDLPHSEIAELVAKPAPLPTCAQLEEFKKQALEFPTHWDFSLGIDLTDEHPQWHFKSSYTQSVWEKWLEKKGLK